MAWNEVKWQFGYILIAQADQDAAVITTKESIFIVSQGFASEIQ